MNSGFLKQKH